jgi:biotin operon repressor
MKSNWTQEEINFLVKESETLSLRKMENKLGKSRKTIRKKILDLGLKIKERTYNIWNAEEESLIKKIYENSTQEELLKLFPNRKIENIEHKAYQLNLSKDRYLYILGKINKLLEETCEALYWIGFLLADGHFSKTNRISLGLSIKDLEHIQSFANFIEYKGQIKIYQKKNYNICSLSIMDNTIVSKLKNKFDIKNNKTYFPPNKVIFERLNNDLFISLLAGFIDGDGCIQNRKNLKNKYIIIKCHQSWIDILNYFVFRLGTITKVPIPNGIINNQGYARIFISNNVHLKYLKNKAVELRLPILKRKWNKIDIGFNTRKENALIYKEKILEMKNNNLKNKDIALKLNISKSTVTKYFYS